MAAAAPERMPKHTEPNTSYRIFGVSQNVIHEGDFVTEGTSYRKYDWRESIRLHLID
jgi:hypothetical protein